MKRQLRLIVLTIGLATSVGGCGLRQGFQPLPPTYKNWAKDGVSPDGVKAALMECGFGNPYTGFDAHKKVPLNTLVLAELCMEQKGFRYLLEDSRACDGKFRSSLPACQSNKNK
ncbi:MAG: hypothetical protein WC023_11970 [Rhodocyclaceae bacterium]